jgi:hypothetical protein
VLEFQWLWGFFMWVILVVVVVWVEWFKVLALLGGA